MNMSQRSKSLVIIFAVLIIDQVLKFWIKMNMSLGDEIVIFKNWFFLNFVENNGMAFGFEFVSKYGKPILSIFRILAAIAFGWYLSRLYKMKNISFGFIISISLIFSGAVGNIIDSMFYGIIFNDSYGQIATFLPENGGYSSFLYGKVVDMFYAPLFGGTYPEWVPLIGGNDFLFFRPVFNVADASITIGIFSILLFYRKYFNKLDETQDEVEISVENSKQSTIEADVC